MNSSNAALSGASGGLVMEGREMDLDLDAALGLGGPARFGVQEARQVGAEAESGSRSRGVVGGQPANDTLMDELLG